METLLLGFCLTSLTLSAILVIVEIFRDQQKQQQFATKLKLLPKHQSPLMKKIRQASPPKMLQPLEILTKQLASLGYVSVKQQVGFSNWVLHTDYRKLEDITHEEFQLLFTVIRQYRARLQEEQPLAKTA